LPVELVDRLESFIFSKGGIADMKYDYLVVGAGLYGSIFAHEAQKRGKRCLVIDKRSHIAGHIYTEKISDIHVHKYGAHIFHTSNQEVWNYIQKFAKFNHFVNSPVAFYKGKIYNLPFNMNTFSQLWGVVTPQEAQEKIYEQNQLRYYENPKNLEEQAINLVGEDIYFKLIKGYTEKQWGRDATEIPAFIITRLPLRFTYNNNYFQDPYQGIPIGGYTAIVERVLNGIEVRLNSDFYRDYRNWREYAHKLVFSGMIDEFYDHRFGFLDYRGLRFEHEELEMENFQGNAVVNYTEKEIPYTRIIEHKHFEFGTQPITIITREYPHDWKYGEEAYYPINDEANNKRLAQYRELANMDKDILFGGRLGNYAYYNMDRVIQMVLDDVKTEFRE
jgi:UDP-galactopyranose mutase